jgi:hypothetical protein
MDSTGSTTAKEATHFMLSWDWKNIQCQPQKSSNHTNWENESVQKSQRKENTKS